MVASVPLELLHIPAMATYSLNRQLVGEWDARPYLRWHWQTLGPLSQLPALVRWGCLLGSNSQTSRLTSETFALFNLHTLLFGSITLRYLMLLSQQLTHLVLLKAAWAHNPRGEQALSQKALVPRYGVRPSNFPNNEMHN